MDPLNGALVVIADVEHGLALIPEGTVVPRGVSIYVQPVSESLPSGRRLATNAAGAGEARRLVFSYSDADFAAARTAIADMLEKQAHEAMMAPPHLTKLSVPSTEPSRSRIGRRIASNDVDQWTYVYFVDGGYMGARRNIIDEGGGWTEYGVETAADAPNTGVYYQAMVLATQSSNLSYGGTDPYSVASFATFGSSGGYVNTPEYAVSTNSGSFSATVWSTGQVQEKNYAPCGHFHEPPCNVFYSSTITNTFP
jgi:hypothetical protein